MAQKQDYRVYVLDKVCTVEWEINIKLSSFFPSPPPPAPPPSSSTASGMHSCRNLHCVKGKLVRLKKKKACLLAGLDALFVEILSI